MVNQLEEKEVTGEGIIEVGRKWKNWYQNEVYDQETKGADSRDKRQAEAVLAIRPGRPWPTPGRGLSKLGPGLPKQRGSSP